VTPEQLQQFEQLKSEVSRLKEDNQRFKASATIPYEVEQAIRDRLRINEIKNAPRPAITAPSGGTTIDSEARTAINSIITALEELGLVVEN
jgi:hypothetical protein